MKNSMDFEKVMEKIKNLSDKNRLTYMDKFGIKTEKAIGISIYTLREIAKEIGFDHGLAEKLWSTGINEVCMLASLIDDPSLLTEEQMERWAKDFSSWDVCDQVCTNLFDRNQLAYKKAFEWSKRSEEFVKRAGFVLIAGLSVHDKKADDSMFEQFFPLIIRESVDERNFVKKAVNWALRNIGKRNKNLNKKAIQVAKKIREIDSKSARWIASDALRELSSERVQKRFKK